MSGPVLLRGARAIAAHLGISPAAVMHMHKQRAIPTFHVRGTPHSTAAALDDWLDLRAAGQIPRWSGPDSLT